MLDKLFLHLQKLAGMRNYLAFWLTLISVLGMLGLAYAKGVDVSFTIPALVSIYIGGRTSEKISAHYNGSKDPNTNTAEIVKMTSEKE